MSQAALQASAPGGFAAVGAIESTHVSKLFPLLFQLLDVNHRLTVLHVGTALAETVEFFSEFRCRLFFLDLFNEPFIRDQDNFSEPELRQAFQQSVRLGQGTKLDLCLFWDFLCYLDDPALRAFNAALQPYLHEGTRAHGFGVHHLAASLQNVQYGVVDRETFSVRRRASRQMALHPHSQVEMGELFTGLGFERGLLLADGQLEMLLRRKH